MQNSDSASNLRGSQDSLMSNSSSLGAGNGLRPAVATGRPRSPGGSISHPLQPTSPSSPAPTMYESKPRRVPNAPYSFDCPVSSEALKLVDAQYRNVDEFKYVTYTPVLCEPEHFSIENKYSLRKNRNGRNIELLIAVTMYNESDEFLSRTLTAIFKNVRYFCELNKQNRVNVDPRRSSGLHDTAPIAQGTDRNTFVRSSNHANAHLEAGLRGDQIWTEDAWQKIMVVIISDGRQKIHTRVKKMLQVMGIYQDELIMPQIVDPLNGKDAGAKDVTAHLFEYTCQSVVDNNFELKSGTKQGIVPVQMMFCLKEKNAKKLNSHKWLFRAFAPLLNPYACVLVDVGTRPKTADAIYHLWKAFDRNLQIAGAAGEICVQLGKNCVACKNVLHPLVASQNFEYKMSNILDKSLESCFGYISVLPGAFSAYRWEALQDTDHEHGPLISYFKGEIPTPKGNIFTANMYLAEDRILCFELVAKLHSKWLLHYVKDARAETDVPTEVPEFISQRRRWLNGTLFCQIYAVAHLARFWKTDHSFLRKMALTLQFFYFILNLIFSWFGIGNFYLAFYLLTLQTLSGPGAPSALAQEIIFYTLRTLYLTIMVSQFICSLGNRPQGAKSIYIGSMAIFAFIMLFMIVVTVILIIQSFNSLPPGSNWFVDGGTSRDMVISIASTYGVYAFSSLIYGEFSHIVTCLVQYLLLLPSYVNTLTIYSTCNIHELSWGTKGDNTNPSASSAGGKKGQDKQKEDEVVEKLEPPLFSEQVLDENYKKALTEIRIAPPEEVSVIDPNTKREDYYKNFRTWFLLAWVLSNGFLVAVISSPSLSKILTGSGDANFSNPYMQFIMYSVAFFSLIRLTGCIVYLIQRAIRGY